MCTYLILWGDLYMGYTKYVICKIDSVIIIYVICELDYVYGVYGLCSVIYVIVMLCNCYI